MVNKFFEIIEEVNFRKNVESLKKSHPRVEEIADDLNWALQKNPFLGQIIEQTAKYEARVIHTTGIGEIPAFWVLFEIDKEKEEVTLVSIRPIPENQS